MARKVNDIKIDALGTEIHAKEQYYLGNKGLTTSASEYEWTADMVQAMIRAKEDIIYFAETFFTIIDKTVRKHIKLRDYQKRMLNTMVKDNRVVFVTSRQIGKTTLMDIYALWLATFFPDQYIAIIGNNDKTAKKILAKIRLAYLELPGWIKTPVLKFNENSMVLENGSQIITSATTGDAIRGDSVSCLILDEFAFVDAGIASDFWNAVTPTLITNPDAKLFVSSTPNGVGNMFHSIVDKAEKKQNGFKIEKVLWSDVPGRDAKWKKNVIATDLDGDEQRFEQEYECRFLGAANSPFSANVFAHVESSIRKPIKIIDDNFKIWKEPENNRIYSIGVDVSEGIGSDYSVIQVFDLTDLENIEQIACYASNSISPIDFTKKVHEVSEMYGTPVLSVERNGCGTGVCDTLYYELNYPRFVTLSERTKKKGSNFRPGIVSGQNTKSPAITNMRYWLENFKLIIRDDNLLSELRHFVRKQNRTWGAESGKNDDLVMSMVWTLNVLHKNIVENEFIVKKKNPSNGMVEEISNKFDYIIEKTNEKLISEDYSEYRGVAVCAFGSSMFSIAPTKSSVDYSFDIFSADRWTELR